MGDATITNSTSFANTNTAVVYGGAIDNNGGTLYVSDCSFNGNTATTAGGAISDQSGEVAIQESIFMNNSAGNGDGGALWIPAGSSGDVSVKSNWFSGNTATGTSSGDGPSPNVYGYVVSYGDNYVADPTGSSGWIGSDMLG
jgi:hypothetical protein